jgi:hypothetical protein
MCLSYLQSRRWHAFNQTFSFNKMVSLQTETSYFHEKTVNSRNHLDVLELSAVSQMTRLQPNLFFQQDGVPPDRPYWESLNKTFPSRWIGRDEPVPSTPRFPNIITLDFFFWGYIKDPAFRPEVGSAVKLCSGINNGSCFCDNPDAAKYTPLNRVPLEILRATNGAHI